jgi:hypothetical protein
VDESIGSPIGSAGLGSSSGPHVSQPCIFCGAKANSREHAIPKWMAKRFALRGRFLHVAESIGGVQPRKHGISLASHRRRIFCQGCQTHFKHLEDAVIPFLAPMGLGTAVTLTAERQRLLAAWGAKTAYALISTERGMEDLAPKDHRYYLREHGMPATEVYVAYAPWAGTNHLHVGEHELQGSSVYPPERMYGAVLAIAQLVLKVFGITETRVPTSVFSGERPSLKQVWPPLDRLIHWPPPHAFGDRHLGQLIRFVPV